MRWIAQHITKHRKLVLIVFGALTIVGGLCALLVPINYNLANFVPEDAPSSIAIRVMADEFDDSIPNVRVFVPDLTLSESLEVKQQLLDLPAVQSVIWLDDFIDLKQPLELQDQTLVSGFRTDAGSLYQVSVTLDDTVATLAQLQEVATESGAVEGQLVDLALAQQSTSSEIGSIIIYMVPLALLLLVLSTLSWLEPLVLLATIGVAVALNMGSNIFLGEISFITAAVAGVLQFAVSMDYGIFMLHSRKQHLEAGEDRHESLKSAVVDSSTAILASSSTTIFGFLALLFMSFKLGPDLGVVLAKGVGFSLICVIFFMPALMSVLDRALLATTHRSFLPSFASLGRGISRIVMISLLIITPLLPVAYLAQGMNDFRYGMGDYPVGSREDSDREFMNEEFGRTLQMALLVPRGQWGSEYQLEQDLAELDEVLGINSFQTQVGRLLPSEVLPQEQLSLLLSENYSRIILTVDTDKEGTEAFALVNEVRRISQEYYPDSYHLTGESVVLEDMRASITSDSTVVNGLAIVSVWLVLLVSFRSLLIPFLLVLTIEGAIWINLSVPYLAGNYIVYIGFLVVSTVQLGATVDYAVLFTQTYLANRAELGKRDSIAATVKSTFGTLLTPVLILGFAGLVLYLVSSVTVVSQLGEVLGRGALISFAMVNLFLPGLLVVFDRVIEKTTWKAKFLRSKR